MSYFHRSFLRLPFDDRNTSLAGKVNLFHTISISSLLTSIIVLPLRAIIYDLYYFRFTSPPFSINSLPTVIFYSPSSLSLDQIHSILSLHKASCLLHIPVCLSISDFIKPFKLYSIQDNKPPIEISIKFKPILISLYMLLLARIVANIIHYSQYSAVPFSFKRLLFYFSSAFYCPHASTYRLKTVFSFFANSTVVYSSEGEFYEEDGFRLCESLQPVNSIELYFPGPFSNISLLGLGPFSWLKTYFYADSAFLPTIHIPTNHNNQHISDLVIRMFPFCRSSVNCLPFRSSNVTLNKISSLPKALLLLPEASPLEVFSLISNSSKLISKMITKDIILLLKLHPSCDLRLNNPHITIVNSFSDLKNYNVLGICHSGSTAPLLFLGNNIMFISFPASNNIRRDCLTYGIYLNPRHLFNLPTLS